MTDDTVLSLSSDQLADILTGADAPTLIDVRDEDEFAAGHIEGAINVPLTQVAPLFDDPENAKPMIFICQSGVRSLQAANFAKIAGLMQPRSLDGGMAAWKRHEVGDQ
ncbi:MAG: rhodanese-like domain-containing protein [Pseudomonadota bacterium]